MTTDTAAPPHARLWEGSSAHGHQRSTPTLLYTLYPGCTRLDSGQQYFFPELFFWAIRILLIVVNFRVFILFLEKPEKTEFFETCMKKEVFSDTRVQEQPPALFITPPANIPSTIWWHLIVPGAESAVRASGSL
jgi:hypothetical protein